MLLGRLRSFGFVQRSDSKERATGLMRILRRMTGSD